MAKYEMSFVSYSGQDPDIDGIGWLPCQSQTKEEAVIEAEKHRSLIGAFTAYVCIAEEEKVMTEEEKKQFMASEAARILAEGSDTEWITPEQRKEFSLLTEEEKKEILAKDQESRSVVYGADHCAHCGMYTGYGVEWCGEC